MPSANTRATEADPQTGVAPVRPGVAGAMERLRRHPAGGIAILFTTVLLACIVVSALFPADFRFLSIPNLRISLAAIPFLGTTALGVGMLMIAGEFDLSVGVVSVLAPVSAAVAFNAGWPLELALMLGIGAGLLVGFLNGFITTRFGIPSFVTTLGMMLVVGGANRFVSYGTFQRFFPPDDFRNVLTGNKILGGGILQVQFLWFLGFAALVYLLVHRHRLGNHFFAAGGNRDAALAVGIEVKRVKIIAFMLCSLAASVAGIISTTRAKSISPFYSHEGLELTAIAACVIGGVFLTGGRGSVIGIALGAMFIYLVEDILLLSGAPSFYLDAFVGAIFVAAVLLNTWFARAGLGSGSGMRFST